MFEYNKNKSLDANFNAWFEANRIEREHWNQPILSRDEAFKIFIEIFKDEVDSNVSQ